jgi:hypothetical protein
MEKAQKGVWRYLLRRWPDLLPALVIWILACASLIFGYRPLWTRAALLLCCGILLPRGIYQLIEIRHLRKQVRASQERMRDADKAFESQMRSIDIDKPKVEEWLKERKP